MTRTRTTTVAMLTILLAIPLFASVATKHHASTDSATLYFSGSFGYTVGSGKARVTAQDVANTGTQTTGQLRFSLLWTPNSPYPSTPVYDTAQYNLGTLAPGQHFTNVDSLLTLPFTDPGNGCYYVTLALEQNVGGNWQVEDYGNFSLRISSGQGCMFSFTGSPMTIASGGSSTLTWSTGGTSATLDNGIGVRPASGSISVSPTVTTTYTCSATGTADGTYRTAQVTITVGLPAPTATFSAAPTSVASGATSTLTWTTTNATSVSIDNGIGSKPTSGSVNVNPTSTTTYTLTATGSGGTITKTATVTVVPAPAVTFTAIPSSIVTGQSSTLTWTTQNATSVSIDNGFGAQPLAGSINVSPTQSTTYTLTATGQGGTTIRQVTVAVGSSPTVTLTATPSTINLGGKAVLTWTSTNAVTASIDHGIGTVPANGSITVSPTSTATYIITVAGTGGQGSAQTTVTVQGGAGRRRSVRH